MESWPICGGNWTGCCRGPGQFNTDEGNGKRIQVNLPNNHSYSYRVGSTWDRMKVDGNKDGIYDIYDPADAVPSTFRYLDYQGANGLNGLRNAVFAYNHSTEYVNNVLALAAKYRA